MSFLLYKRLNSKILRDFHKDKNMLQYLKLDAESCFTYNDMNVKG
jgi:hypothetical protein